MNGTREKQKNKIIQIIIHRLREPFLFKKNADTRIITVSSKDRTKEKVACTQQCRVCVEKQL